MKWYYQNDKGVVGPLSREAIMELHACGVVKGESQVCQEGSQAWATYEAAIIKTPELVKSTGGNPEKLIKFYCPFCHAKLAARLEDAGGSLDCPSCKAELVVPAGFAQVKPPQRLQPPAPAPAAPPVAAPKPLVLPKPAAPQLTSATADGPKPMVLSKPGAAQPVSVPASKPLVLPKSAAKQTEPDQQPAVASEPEAELAKPNPKALLIKGRIENAKQFSLPKAQYSLGRKLYEARILLQMKDEIEELETLMAEAEDQQAEEKEASNAAALPFGKKSSKNNYEVHFQKLKEALTRLGGLGHKASEVTSSAEYSDEINAITSIESEIEKLEEEIKSI